MNFQSGLLATPAPAFPESYGEGAARWDAAVTALPGGALRQDYPCPADPTLITQTALIGDRDAAAMVVVLGGTHGVEGFAGTAIQCDLLHLLAQGLVKRDSGIALLLVNALNPWGYHYLHRFDHLGIDANRNCVDFTAALPDNPGYCQLQPLFAIADQNRRRAALREAAGAMGPRAYEIAYSGGQYIDPTGPFYGGREKGHCRQVTEALIERYGLAGRRLAVIDIHTGLGPYSYGEVICDHPAASPGHHTARRWYGPACTSAEEGSSSSVPKLGLLDFAWHAIMDAGSCFVTLEFGTLGTESLFEVLLDDRPRPGPPWARGSDALREHFCPSDPYWREAVIFRGRQVFCQALSGVSH